MSQVWRKNNVTIFFQSNNKSRKSFLFSYFSRKYKFHSLAVWGKKEFSNTTVRAKDIFTFDD